MKAVIAILSLLPLLGAASPVAEDVKPSNVATGPLPVIAQSLPLDSFTRDGADSRNSRTANRKSASAAGFCERGYPFYCRGRCCQLNRCCAMECCNNRATFCGADGYCYI